MKGDAILMSFLLVLSCKTMSYDANAKYINYHKKNDEEKEFILKNAVVKGKNFKDKKIAFTKKGFLEMTGGVEFPCIGIRFSYEGYGFATYIEIKRKSGKYVSNYGKVYDTLDKVLEESLKEEIFTSLKNNGKDAEKLWNDFVKEGGLKEFIEISKKEIIDEEFLLSPFNDIFG